jgi:uncharacterized protein YmfQ (DUF2313 family)
VSAKSELTIITSPEAKKMLGMVTDGFYDNAYIVQWLFQVIGLEWDNMASWSDSLTAEAFPQTCTWSIAYWEQAYGITPNPALPLEFRRQQILTKRLQSPPINPARVEKILEALTGETVEITENVADYTFRVTIYEEPGDSVNGPLVKAQLDQIKPSHLAYIYELAMITQANSYAGIRWQGMNMAITAEVSVYGME